MQEWSTHNFKKSCRLKVIILAGGVKMEQSYLLIKAEPEYICKTLGGGKIFQDL